MSTEQCDTDPAEEIDCWNCEDQGWYVTVGGIKMPCPECKLGDVNFYHEDRAFLASQVNAEMELAEMVHADDGLGEQAENELEAWERSRD